MAKKLNLLKPDKKTIYLENGKGQKVDFLQISKQLTLHGLKSDVKAGALQFKKCMEFAEKKPSRVVLIEAENEEEGLMAASYLASAYNWKEKVYSSYNPYLDFEPDDISDLDLDELLECGSEQAVERDLDDYKNIENEFEFNEDLEGDGVY